MREMTEKAVLFDKAIGDLWIAEQIYKLRADYAIWHCSQSIEKMLKGTLKCCGKNYDHTHEISDLLEECLKAANVVISDDIQKDILYLSRINNSIRYKNRGIDPDGEAKGIIKKTSGIMDHLSQIPDIKQYYQEALQLHNKMLKTLNKD